MAGSSPTLKRVVSYRLLNRIKMSQVSLVKGKRKYVHSRTTIGSEVGCWWSQEVRFGGGLPVKESVR